MKRIVKASLLLAFTLISTAVFAANAFAQEEWYMIFGAGDEPKRVAFFIDGNSLGAAGGVNKIDLLTVFEEAGSPQYSLSHMEFKCAANQMRIASGVNLGFDMKEVPFNATPWNAVKSGLMERIKGLACGPEKFAEARSMSIGKGGMVDDKLFNAELEKRGMPGALLLMTRPNMPNIDRMLAVLWDNFWQAPRPPRDDVAQVTPKADPKPGPGGTNPGPGVRPGAKPGRIDEQGSNAALNRGNEFFDKKMWSQAEEQYEEALRLNPKNAAAVSNLGLIKLRLEYYADALTYFNKAVDINPKFADPYFNRGIIYEKAGAFTLAIGEYTKAIKYDPNFLSAYFNRGLIYFEQEHKFDLAEADFTKAIQGDPQFANGYFTRADLYESWGKDALAEADRKKWKSLGGEALPGFYGRRRSLFPEAQFDADMAEAALKPGTATLRGKACAFVNKGLWGLGGGEKYNADGVRVALFPVTPYLEKWYQLRDKKEDKKTGVYVNREVQKYALLATTNGNGEFVFSRLKPGRYFVQIIFNFTVRRNARVAVGSSQHQEGNTIVNTTYWEDREYFTDHNSRLESFVDITSEGESKKITVKNKKFALFGCKDLP